MFAGRIRDRSENNEVYIPLGFALLRDRSVGWDLFNSFRRVHFLPQLRRLSADAKVESGRLRFDQCPPLLSLLGRFCFHLRARGLTPSRCAGRSVEPMCPPTGLDPLPSRSRSPPPTKGDSDRESDSSKSALSPLVPGPFLS